MSILPWLERFFDRIAQFDEVVKPSRALVVMTAHSCFSDIMMAMSGRVVALAVKVPVLRIGKRGRMKPMGSIERHAHSQKHAFVVPDFGEKILALMQPDSIQPHE